MLRHIIRVVSASEMVVIMQESGSELKVKSGCSKPWRRSVEQGWGGKQARQAHARHAFPCTAKLYLSNQRGQQLVNVKVLCLGGLHASSSSLCSVFSIICAISDMPSLMPADMRTPILPGILSMLRGFTTEWSGHGCRMIDSNGSSRFMHGRTIRGTRYSPR